MMSAEDLAKALGGKRAGAQFVAYCPAHDDSTPSLTIRAGSNGSSGKILLHCHGGCSNADVITVLKDRELWPVSSQDQNYPRPVSSPREEKSPATFSNLESLQSFLGKTGSVRFFHYPLAAGIHWGMARIDMSTGKKTFRAWHKVQDGKIVLAKPPTEKLPLYNSDRLPDDRTVPIWVVEGEKCVEALAGLCVHVVTSANGAGSAKHSDWSVLDGRPCIIWPDSDQAGRKYLDEVKACILKRVAKLDIVSLEDLGLEEGEDCADWIAGGQTDLSKVRIIEALDPKDLSLAEIKRGKKTIAISNDPHYTDLGNCYRLVRRHGENIRYVSVWKKWLIWMGTYWQIDNNGAVERLAKDTVLKIPQEGIEELDRLARIVDEAERDKTQKKITEILGWGKKSEADNRLGAMINLAKSELQIALAPEDFDTDPFLLGVKNGVIDLRAGRLIEPRRDQYITKNSRIDYQPGAKAPIWEKFLERIQPDPAVRAFMRRWCGYCLTGDTSEQCFTIFYGTGNNGKTTLVDTLMHILGTWARQADFKTFVMKDRDAASNDLARLFGTRLVTATESQENTRLDEAVIKSLTGGDRITARYLYSEFFEYTPSFKIILSSNHKPQIRGTDEGIWRRIRLVPFLVTIPDEEKDPHLKKKLFVEAPGILNWMLDGCREWQQIGLGMPAAIQIATGEYRESSDLIGRWISERCILTSRAEGTIKNLYGDFCSWTEEEGIDRPPIKRKFSEALFEKGFKKVRIGHKSLAGFYGIGLIADPADVADEVSGKYLHEEITKEKLSEKRSASSATSADLIDLDHPEGGKN